MVRYAPNKMSAATERRYFELIREGLSGSEAARQVGVSLSCGSLWFIDAGRVTGRARIDHTACGYKCLRYRRDP